MAQNIVGIDLGSYSLKVVYLQRRVDEHKILDYFELPLSANSRLSHDEQVREALHNVFENHGIKPDVVCVCYPGHLTSTRILSLPFTNSKKIAQVISFEIENYIPFALEDTFYDYHVIKQTETQSDVLCVYAPEAKFSRYLDALMASGVDPKYFGADIIDLAAVAHVAMLPSQGYYAICDFGHSKTNLIIMRGKELCYARTIGIGGLHFTRAVQRSYNLNYDKAESLKMARGKVNIREQDSDQVSRILTKVASELVSAIKQTFLGAQGSLDNFSIPAVYCCGGSFRISGFHDFLSFHLRANVFELNVLTYVTHDFESTEEVGKVIPQALATALKPVYSNRLPKINFRKGPFAFKQDIQFITNEFKSVGVLLGVIFLLAVVYYFYADHHYSERMAAVDKQVENLLQKEFKELGIVKTGKNRRGNQRPLTEYLKSAKSKLSTIKSEAPQLGEDRKRVMDVMYDLSVALPPKKDISFEISEFNFADGFVRLNSHTDDPLNVEKVVAALNKSKKFGVIEAGDPQAKPGNLWEFVLKINLQ